MLLARPACKSAGYCSNACLAEAVTVAALTAASTQLLSLCKWCNKRVLKLSSSPLNTVLNQTVTVFVKHSISMRYDNT
eukprot:14347-Heterococcus_DN1.PRE.2